MRVSLKEWALEESAQQEERTRRASQAHVYFNFPIAGTPPETSIPAERNVQFPGKWSVENPAK